MTATAINQEAMDALQRLPEEANTEDMMYRLYVLESVRRGQEDARQGRTKTLEEALEELREWSSD